MPSDAEKHCPLCNESWPADAEFFYPENNKCGLSCCCKACYKERYRPAGSRAKRPLPSKARPTDALAQVWTLQ